MFQRKHQLWRIILMLIVVLGIGGALQKPADGKAILRPGVVQRLLSWGRNNSYQQGQQQLPPTKQQAMVVLTPAVRQQLGTNITWNGHGAFIINNNRSGLNANVASAPYAVNHVDSQGRAWQGDAWLNRTTRQYQNRTATGNGATGWKPAGFLQAYNLTGGYSHAYDRGHLLGYALVGGIRGFNASESNPRNIATQTAWANEARSSMSTGQNYYEGIVRKALDQGKQVRYRVTDIYSGSSVVPAGAHIQAQSKDGSVNFNVFVPNVQRNIDINYATGAVKQR
ncbi:DNA/RNA non-specific endonuclease [Limosilactobacillus sp.]|uniref:DNA/RNA non-specific endonuclease n=1 Tax=Limosilactobacillus sp. TaxID=2773925 RepID=UPI00359F6BDA